MKRPRGIKKPKGYVSDDPTRNYFIANFGKAEGSAARLYNDCREFAELMQMEVKSNPDEDVVTINRYDEKSVNPFGHRAMTAEEMPKEIGERIICQVACAMKYGNGKFFRDLAAICEKGFDGDDLRSWLILMHFFHGSGFQKGAKQDRQYSAKQLCELTVKRGIKAAISERYMHQVCTELGIKLLDTRGKK